jgi:hypothetical protein
MKICRFDIGEELPLALARLVWAWEEKRAPRGCAPRAAFPLLRLPGGPRGAFVLAPRGDETYEPRLIGADCPAEAGQLSDAALEAWLTCAPMAIDTGAWRGILVPLADGEAHVVLGLTVPAANPVREAA